MKNYKVLTLNPGSTSTKIALFEGEECLYSKNVSHDAGELEKFASLSEQLPYRRDMILSLLKEANVSLEDVDVFVGRGGGLLAMEGGTYEVTDLMLDHAKNCANGVIHPASLGPQLAREFAEQYGAKAMVVNPPDVDELQDLARMTGIKGVNRVIHLHALNLKETAIRHSKNVMQKKYEDCNYIILHLGGGTSITAHEKGKMIDGNRAGDGQGPISPNRSGDLCVDDVIKCIKKGISPDEAKDYASSKGGLLAWCGTDDLREVKAMIANGNKKAELVYNTMIYSMGKWTAMMAGALKGKVDAILLTGGMARDTELCDKLAEYISWIAPIYNYAGSFETEALGFGAIRVLKGDEEAKIYTGKPVWNGFPWDKE